MSKHLLLTILTFALTLGAAQMALAQDAGTDEFVAGVDVDPVPVTSIMSLVRYPARAIDSNWEGKSVVLALVDTSGRVRRAKVVESSGHPILDTAAKRALLRETFTPAMAAGKPVAVWYRAPVSFKISDSLRALLLERRNSKNVDRDPVLLVPLSALVIYPQEAKRKLWEGKTVVRGLVDTNGIVIKTVIDQSSGHPLLDAAATTAMIRARFKPATHNGKLVRVWFVSPISFSLHP